jgi:hypothetical protein
MLRFPAATCCLLPVETDPQYFAADANTWD